jgi:anti-sigma regulatory factor (Ser/Thr protein kinase)
MLGVLRTPRLQPERRRLLERSFRFPATVDAPRLARHALDGWVNDLIGIDRGDDVRLLATELVTNAIQHGGVSSREEVTVDVSATDGFLSVVVGQPTSAEQAVTPTGRRPDEGGLGLHLVDRLADAWGVVPGIPGSVWFDVVRSGGG